MIANYVKAGLICLCVLGMSNNSVVQTSSAPIKNIVLVHGAWADDSGWKGVYDILVKDDPTLSQRRSNRLRNSDVELWPALQAQTPD